MARRNLDWHVGWWSEEYIFSNDQQVYLTLITDQELLDYEDDVIVERVVGQYQLVNADSGNTINLHTRLTVRPENETALFTLDMTLAANADEQFMWHKVHRIGNNESNMAPFAHPEHHMLDCRVNRKLEGLDRLVFCIELMKLTGATELANFYVAAWLRVLVKT